MASSSSKRGVNVWPIRVTRPGPAIGGGAASSRSIVGEPDDARVAQLAIRAVRDARAYRHACWIVAGVLDLGIAGDWPHNGEIDIMEYYRGILLANVAWGGAKRFEAIWADSRKPIDSFKDAGWSSAFHVWRMDWDERAIVLSVDGERLNEVLLSRTVNQDGTAANPFQQPQYLLLNLAVGGTQGGDPAKTTFPARFEIDFVRVYQAADRQPGR